MGNVFSKAFCGRLFLVAVAENGSIQMDLTLE